MCTTKLRATVFVLLGVLHSAAALRADAPPRLDRHGDPLPPGAVARMGTVRLRTGNHVNSMAWTPDGRFFATAGEGRFVQVWDPASGKEVYRVPTLASRVCCVTFSPDGKWLAVTGEHSEINLWDATLFGDQAKPRQLTGHGSGSGLVFAPDSKTLYSCGYDGFIRAWDVATGRELRRFGPGKEQWSACIALDHEGKLLVSRELGLDGDKNQMVTASLWNAATGERIRPLGKPERARSSSPSYSAVFARDGQTVVAASDDVVKIWNAANGAEIAALKIRTAGAAFAPDGKSLYGVDNGQIRQWAVPSGRLLRSFAKEGLGDSNPVALSPDGKTIATGRPIVALWDVETGAPRHAWPGHDTTIWSLFFLNGGKELLSGGFDSPAYRWDLEGRLLGQWKPPGRNCYWPTAALSPDGKTLAIQGNQLQALLVDPFTGAPRQSFANHQDKKWRQTPYSSIQFGFSPDSRRVVSSGSGVDRHVRMWEADTAKEIWNVTTDPTKTPVQGFALAPDGKTMFVTTDGPVKVYEVGQAAVQRQIGDAKSEIRNLCLSRDGRRLAGVESKNIFIWDAATGAELGRVPRPKRGAWHDMIFIKFSPDGRMLALWDREEPTVRCLEVASGQVRMETTGHLEMVLSAEFSADGRLMATGGTDTTVLLWDLDALALVGDPAKGAAGSVDVDKLERELASPDAKTAHRAVVGLRQLGPKAVALLADRLQPVHHRPLAACIADLDDDRFQVRERAFEELLGRPGDKAELAKILASSKSVEVRARLQRILGEYDPQKDVRRLRSLRGLETLEGMGTPQARRIVENLARGTPDAELTLEAAATLKRMP
jgi:WD40 repeat protein